MEPAPADRFRLRHDALAAAARRTHRRFLATLVAAALAVLGLWVAALREQGQGPRVLVLGYVLLAGLAAASQRRRMARFRARWASFEIALGADAIVRTADGLPPARIARADVVAVEEGPRGISVRDRAGRGVLVPREVERYADARAALLAWRR